MRTKMAALAAGFLLVSAPAFAAGDATRINSGARAPAQNDTTQAETTQGANQGANAGGVNENTRTARTQDRTDNNWNQTQNQSAGQATPGSPDAGLTPQTDNGRANGPNAPAQPY